MKDEHEAAIEHYRTMAQAAAGAWRSLDEAKIARDDIFHREMARDADTPTDSLSAWVRKGNTETRIRSIPEYIAACTRVRECQMSAFDRNAEEEIAASQMRRLER